MTRCASFLVLCAALAGCAQAPVPIADRFYRLEPRTVAVPPRGAASGPVLEGTLAVQRFAADALLGQRALVYADPAAGGALLQYNYHFWADPPPVMLQALAIRALRAAGVARQVTTPELAADAEYVLSGRIRRLEHLPGGAPAVVAALELVIVPRARSAPLVVAEYEVTRALSEPGLDAAARAMGDAVGEVLARFVAGLPRE